MSDGNFNHCVIKIPCGYLAIILDFNFQGAQGRAGENGQDGKPGIAVSARFLFHTLVGIMYLREASHIDFVHKKRHAFFSTLPRPLRHYLSCRLKD